MLEVLIRRSFFSLVPFVALFSHLVTAQTLVNGQLFTTGLAIIDSPASGNPGHAGSSIPIAIDVSGDGKLPSAASLPGSGLSTSYQLLEIYLVSSETNINMTVSSGPGLLTNETGSTVKHDNWIIPTCVPAGNYNLTFYETSTYNGQGIFTITPIPIPISNGSPSGQCTDLNTLQAQPQNSSSLTQSPFISTTASSPPPASGTAAVFGTGPSVTLTVLTAFLFFFF